MKKIKILGVLLICLIVNISCSDNDTNVKLSDKQNLTKKTWIFKNFKFLDSSNNSKKYTSEDFENVVDNNYNELSLEFNENGEGFVTRKTKTTVKFTWELTNDKLKIVIPNPAESSDDVHTYTISVSDSQLALTMTEEFVVFINGDELGAKGIQYYK
ncbi:DUF5640 domain-containing protein [uncultured Tenacibaculum sp.]|uniref:DUF5640 domain-containing protein n=1 Tax=uncultured Tenacibaculum sp. TaxID=174713 RepID=UPI00260C2BF2|nr:DUF5640 domain-containing protein [uncultured Tenacibaculum sp.]